MLKSQRKLIWLILGRKLPSFGAGWHMTCYGMEKTRLKEIKWLTLMSSCTSVSHLRIQPRQMLILSPAVLNQNIHCLPLELSLSLSPAETLSPAISSSQCQAATFNPRFKNLKCSPKSEGDKVWSMLLEVLKEQHSDVETTEPKPPKKKINLLLVAFDSDDENEHVGWHSFGLLSSRTHHQYGCTSSGMVVEAWRDT
ncbi:uncharacterized protein LOC144264289 [Eretmochelys imbricata]